MNPSRHRFEADCGRVTISRQTDIFRHVGYLYDWDYPGPFWHFLGKMAAKAIFDDKAELRIFKFVAVGRREFIAYTTSMWMAAVEAGKTAGVAELPPLNVIEVTFKKPQPGKPLEMNWAPARGLFTAKIRQCRLRFTRYSRRQTNPKGTLGNKPDDDDDDDVLDVNPAGSFIPEGPLE